MSSFKWRNYNWNIGLWWGNHHNDRDVWWNQDSVLRDTDGNLILDVVEHPVVFDDKVYKYSVGCVQSKEEFKYGLFRWKCKLPKGKGMWPALWLASRQEWPPELDCMEGWSKTDKPTYKNGLFKYKVHPTVHWGTPDNHKQKRGKKACILSFNEDKINEFDLLWLPDYVFVIYNGWVVGSFDNKEMLKHLNKENVKMTPIMSLNLTPDGKSFDYSDYKKNGSPMIVYDFEYKPIEKFDFIFYSPGCIRFIDK